MNNWKPKYPPFRKFKKEVFSKVGKVSQFIYQIGEYPALHQPSAEVSINQIASDEMQRKFKYIKKCLIQYRKITGVGRGITAVQVGIPERFSVIYTPEELLIIVNPQITKKSSSLLTYPEMCMSANPIIAPTIRPSWIEFEYFDEKGTQKKWYTKDDTPFGLMMNRVFQHEIDHMEGTVNIDLVRSPKDILLHSDPAFYDSAKFEKVSS